MWILSSYGKIIGEPAKSEAEIAKRLGFSRQYLNRRLKEGKNIYTYKGQTVLIQRKMEFRAGKKEFETKKQMARFLGVPLEEINSIFSKNDCGVVETKNGPVGVSRIVGSTIPLRPRPISAIRVVSAEGPQEFPSIAAAAKELGIGPKTISQALRNGRDFFTRKSDKKNFEIEIPGETKPAYVVYREKMAQLLKMTLDTESKAEAEKLIEEMKNLKPEPKVKIPGEKPKDTMEKYLNETRVFERDCHLAEDERKAAEKPIPLPRTKKTPEGRQPPVPLPRRKKKEGEATAETPQEKKKEIPEVEEFVPQSSWLLQRIEKEADKILESFLDYAKPPEEDEIWYKDQMMKLLCQYPEWGFCETVSRNYQIIKMVLFNRKTGQNIPMNKSQDVVSYFQNQDYEDFPQKDEIDQDQPQDGVLSFFAIKCYADHKPREEWDLFFFVKR